MGKKSQAKFLNVDLELRSRNDLSPLVQALEPGLFLLHHGTMEGRNFASFEVNAAAPADANAACGTLLRALENLSGPARRGLEQCESIKFALGFEGSETNLVDSSVGKENIRRIAELGGELTISIYAGQPANRD